MKNYYEKHIMTTHTHWSQLHLKKTKTTSISKMNMLLVVWTKYQLEEINFLELKDRVRAINLLSEWVSGFSVNDTAYTRFRHGGLLSSENNRHFLKLFQEKKFKNIDQYGVDDFPLLDREESHINKEKDL